MQLPTHNTRYKWYVLFLAALTNTFVVAIPSICMSVLFKEIQDELRLTLVQVGFIWGISGFPLILTGLLAGAAGDRFGPRRVLRWMIPLTALAGALRGLTQTFPLLVLVTVLLGGLTPFLTINNFKLIRMWFPDQQLGLASGVISMGMALGFLLGSLLSATLVSPWLGGWRMTFLFYGALALLFFLPWIFMRPAPQEGQPAQQAAAARPMAQSMAHVMSLRSAWLLGLALLCVGGSVQGLLGYLPLYLRGLGWAPVHADGALAAFHSISLLAVLPLTMSSDRLGSRKKVLLGAAVLLCAGVALLAFTRGAGIWVGVLLAGLTRDGMMALFLTMIVELDGIGTAYAGTATGFLMIFSGVGGLLAPPLGNSLAAAGSGAPFMFWAALIMLSVLCLGLIRGKGQTA